jgi:hypothetical protein
MGCPWLVAAAAAALLANVAAGTEPNCSWMRKHEGRNYVREHCCCLRRPSVNDCPPCPPGLLQVLLPHANYATYIDTIGASGGATFRNTTTSYAAVQFSIDVYPGSGGAASATIVINISDTTFATTHHDPAECACEKNEGPVWWRCGPAYFATAFSCAVAVRTPHRSPCRRGAASCTFFVCPHLFAKCGERNARRALTRQASP